MTPRAPSRLSRAEDEAYGFDPARIADVDPSLRAPTALQGAKSGATSAATSAPDTGRATSPGARVVRST